MSLIIMLLLALAFSLPLLLVFFRSGQPVSRRETTLALYRAQLAALEQDQALGWIDESGYKNAKLEIEHRLLAADKLPAEPTGGRAKMLLTLTIIILPIGGFVLYLPGSTPFLPSVPHAWLIKKQAAEQKQLEHLILLLRTHLAHVPPASANASEGQAYLAEALTAQQGMVTPEALSLFKQSLAHAPIDSPWRALDQQAIAHAMAQTSP